VSPTTGAIAFWIRRAVVRTVEADGYGFLPGGHAVSVGRGFPEIQLFRLDVETGKEEKVAAVEIPENVSGFSFADDLQTWATVDDEKVELRDLDSDRGFRKRHPPGALRPQYHSRYAAILYFDSSPGWRPSRSGVGLDLAPPGVIVDGDRCGPRGSRSTRQFAARLGGEDLGGLRHSGRLVGRGPGRHT
jgi:hypothetical protein